VESSIIIERRPSLKNSASLFARQGSGSCLRHRFNGIRQDACGEKFGTMMGISPEMAAEFMVEHGCDILALNCGTGIDMKFAADTARRYRSISGLPIMAQPTPVCPFLKHEGLYKETPDEMALGISELLEAGPASSRVLRFRRLRTSESQRGFE